MGSLGSISLNNELQVIKYWPLPLADLREVDIEYALLKILIEQITMAEFGLKRSDFDQFG